MTTTPIRQAAALARTHIEELFADENIREIGLEEIEFDSDRHEWRVTIGFIRPGVHTSFDTGKLAPLERAHKIVLITDADAQVIAIKDRPPD